MCTRPACSAMSPGQPSVLACPPSAVPGLPPAGMSHRSRYWRPASRSRCPADYEAPAAARTAPGAPEPLVLSGPGKWLVGLILAVGAATPLALLALLFVPITQAPPAGSAPASA